VKEKVRIAKENANKYVNRCEKCGESNVKMEAG
jgi:hypothetical protein